MSKHNKVSKEEKAKIVMTVLRGEKTVSEIASQYAVHPNLISRWKQQAVNNMAELFEDEREKIDRKMYREQVHKIEQLEKLVGQREYELDWLKKNYPSQTITEKLKSVDRENHRITLSRQTELLSVSRFSLYYQSEFNERDLLIMNLIDEIFTEDPTYGKRTIAHIIRRDHKIPVGKQHVRTLMIKIGINPICPQKKKNTSKPDKQNAIYPYLLSGLAIVRTNQVWSTDITYIKLKHGFCYLVAIIDWYSRYVISWELSNTMDLDFCLRMQERAYALATPEIFNSDQGSHFTSPKFTALPPSLGVQVSMDGKGRCLDNIFIERLWWTVKQQDIYIKHYESVAECRAGLIKFFEKYNNHRPHQGISYQTPAEVYFGQNKKTAPMEQINICNFNLNTVSVCPTI
ncbi:IS3 family transposase [Candidatus Falkowbacteria bacterium CG10_big_fil_rev_8_21_14_0_10_39_9]|uniref:IS3 family transposase n=1 Tax=Candidatus Falkowbacteria bacterium CG10_big_fil_rev_8_21_14_0_10_39_9 TaxID=1974566 RepID=A0A2M6WNF5_9BACT|nr:MAG: IS3 family transposase [Candidatus Falkowbacteria bacterium CG10_big_fil_rev_8_21_14_0_10_39_9]